MLISHWLIASNVVDVVMLLLSRCRNIAFHWIVFKINMMMKILHKFSTFPLLIDCGLHSNAYEWLKKHISSLYLKSDENETKIPNLWIVFHWNFPLYTFFMKNIFKSFIFHNSVAWLKIYQQLISKMHIKSSTTTLRWYPIKLFASFYIVSMSFTQLNAIIESPSRTSWINYAILHLRRGWLSGFYSRLKSISNYCNLMMMKIF